MVGTSRVAEEEEELEEDDAALEEEEPEVEVRLEERRSVAFLEGAVALASATAARTVAYSLSLTPSTTFPVIELIIVPTVDVMPANIVFPKLSRDPAVESIEDVEEEADDDDDDEEEDEPPHPADDTTSSS